MEKIDCFKNGVFAFQTTAEDGNLATHTGDDLASVLKNRRRLQSILPSEPLWLNQTHSVNVIDAENYDSENHNADAIISSQKNKVLAILTADCLPILVAGKNEIAAIHAGWRGLAHGIVEHAFSRLKESPADCRVFLGVCIQSCCFEVGSDVLKAFVGFESAFSTVNGRFFLNLQEIATLKLFKIGVLKEHIVKESACTACDSRFFSYRKTKTIARQATFIYKT